MTVILIIQQLVIYNSASFMLSHNKISELQITMPSTSKRVMRYEVVLIMSLNVIEEILDFISFIDVIFVFY
jgi:hypothetical protein